MTALSLLQLELGYTISGNIMKSLYLTGLTALALLGSSFSAHADSFNTKRCMNMGNALDAPKEGDWGHKIDAKSFKIVADAGFDTVRIPVKWSAHTSGAPTFRIKERFFQRVTEVIDQALANDLQVILNIHHFDELNEAPEENYAKFIALWDQIATRYKDLPESVYFEVINEPNGNFKGDIMRKIVTQGFKKIRETNPTRILIMGGDDWSGIKTIPSIPAIDDPNQVYTFHYYDPFEFTHQKAGWTDLKNSGTKGWGSSADKAELKAAARYAAKVQRETGIPLFLGEIGAYEKAPYSGVVNYTLETRKAFEAAGISWCVWNFTATFPFYDTKRKEWDLKKLGALGMSPNGTPVESMAEKATQRVSYSAQTIDDAFNGLRRKIGRDGELLMAPFADQLTGYGPAKLKVVKDKNVPDGSATEVKVSRKGKNPWDSGLSGPIPTAIKKGDTIVMSYWAKTVKGDGVISNAGLQLSGEPYTALAMKPASLGKDWQEFYVTAKASRDYAPSEAGYTIQVAGAKQTLRIGPIFILNLGQNVSPSSLSHL